METIARQARLVQLLAVPGLLLSYYLWLFHNGDVLAVCGSGGWDDCGAVSGPGAPYAAVGPIPVALVGLVGYGALFLAVWLADWWPWLRRNLAEVLLGLGGLGFLFSLWLTGLELFVIHAFCRYCLVSAGLSTLIFLLALSHLRAAYAETEVPAPG